MLALSVRQPWASLIVLGIQRVENRSWATRHRGRLAIHASARPDDQGGSELPDGLAVAELPLGAIIGVVTLTDCVPIEDLPAALRDDPHAQGPWCWILADPKPLARPIMCKGRLKLWDVPRALLSALRRAV